ncbi:uncharacterized protein BYT42DRAFT_194410 [Radiomyces spectabilis]|uniref:uncharacterized protein n=1 Tax=Radiomyces spectabilis TaxID=64574 RepID=UPI00221FD8DB|nr:uncharacterized protein BYT42DRAFT_194410 [Radiomyces spectabilis]KAI8391438.1 hypothetical protein BYT42DRAFT_194410 [Radiomyces spectabilis]
MISICIVHADQVFVLHYENAAMREPHLTPSFCSLFLFSFFFFVTSPFIPSDIFFSFFFYSPLSFSLSSFPFFFLPSSNNNRETPYFFLFLSFLFLFTKGITLFQTPIPFFSIVFAQDLLFFVTLIFFYYIY